MAQTITLYRLIRSDEEDDLHSHGLFQKDPDSNTTISDHVEYGSISGSQSSFISFTRNFHLAEYWLNKDRNAYYRMIVKVQVPIDDPSVIDLRGSSVLRKKAKNYAKNMEEVLISRHIKREEITKAYVFKTNFLPSDMSSNEYLQNCYGAPYEYSPILIEESEEEYLKLMQLEEDAELDERIQQHLQDVADGVDDESIMQPHPTSS